MASAAPAVWTGLTLAALAAATAYAGGLTIVLTRRPDADHRELLPAAEPVERQLRRVLQSAHVRANLCQVAPKVARV